MWKPRLTPPLISHFPFSLLCGQTCIFPVLHGKGAEANELAKWNCVVIARHRLAPSCSWCSLPAHTTPGTRDIPPHPTASVGTVDSPPASPRVGSCNSQPDPSNSTFYPSPVPALYPLRYLLSHLPPLPPVLPPVLSHTPTPLLWLSAPSHSCPS